MLTLRGCYCVQDTHPLVSHPSGPQRAILGFERRRRSCFGNCNRWVLIHDAVFLPVNPVAMLPDPRHPEDAVVGVFKCRDDKLGCVGVGV
jgi:hypothetical protein